MSSRVTVRKKTNCGKIRAEVEGEMKMIIEKTVSALLEKRRTAKDPVHKLLWIEKGDAMGLVNEVFDEIKDDHKGIGA